MRSIVFTSVCLITIIIVGACTEQKKDYLPGELEYDKSVEAAEHTIKTIVESGTEPLPYCPSLKRHYDQGVTAFERLMPNLKGMSLRNRDMRLQTIREFIEANC